MKAVHGLALASATVAIGFAWYVHAAISNQRTVKEALDQYGHRVRARYEPRCRSAGVPWPPKRLRLLAFKEERVLEVWAAGPTGRFCNLETFPILGASGGPGPKRREGDCQVPEGDYRLTALNPNSRFHLSIRVDYPNEEDVARSTVPLSEMGGDIYLHGGKASIGCIAVGNPRIEELFCLAALVEDRRILIAPADMRRQVVPVGDPAARDLHQRLERQLADFR